MQFWCLEWNRASVTLALSGVCEGVPACTQSSHCLAGCVNFSEGALIRLANCGGCGESSFLSDSALRSADFQEKNGDPPPLSPTHFSISLFLSRLPPVLLFSPPSCCRAPTLFHFSLIFLFCDSPWVWLKVILQHWLTFSVQGAQGAARREGEEIQGRGLRAAVEGEGGSRADRLSTGACSHHFLLQT